MGKYWFNRNVVIYYTEPCYLLLCCFFSFRRVSGLRPLSPSPPKTSAPCKTSTRPPNRKIWIKAFLMACTERTPMSPRLSPPPLLLPHLHVTEGRHRLVTRWADLMTFIHPVITSAKKAASLFVLLFALLLAYFNETRWKATSNEPGEQDYRCTTISYAWRFISFPSIIYG